MIRLRQVHSVLQWLPPSGKIEIIPEPAGQRDMPPAPVLADAFGQVGVVEVLRQIQPEEAADADGHIAVAGKVKIQLQHVGHVPQHQHGGGHGVGGHRGHPLVDQGDLVGDDGLFGKTEDEPLDAIGKAVGGHTAGFAPGIQHRSLLPVTDDGAGGTVAEEGKEHKEPQGIAGGLHMADGHVDAVADGREDVEADAQGQGRRQDRQQAGHMKVLTVSAANPAYLKTASTPRSATISRVSSTFLKGRCFSARPPSQLRAASPTSRAAPRRPDQAKNARLNRQSTALRAKRGSR